MLGRLKFYIYFLINFKSLYTFTWQKILIMSKLFLRIDPPYEFEKTLQYDSDTKSVVNKINTVREKNHCGENLQFKGKWDNVFQREEIGNTVINSINKILPFSPDEKFSPAIKNLKTKGYANLPEKNFSRDEIEDVLQYLEKKKLFPSPVAHRSLEPPSTKNVLKNGHEPFGSYDIQTILRSSILAKLVGDEDIINLIGTYFGCLPTLCNTNLYWSFLRSNSHSSGPQHFHRDADDYRIINIYVNLTDSSENDGAYCHIENTHNLKQASKSFNNKRGSTLPDKLNPLGRPLTPEDLFELPLKGYGFDQLYGHLFKDNIKQIFGPAGTVRCADGYGLHRAIPPTSHDRLLFWMTYSLTRTSTGTIGVPHQKRVPYSKVQQHIKDTSLNKYVLRNTIDFRK